MNSELNIRNDDYCIRRWPWQSIVALLLLLIVSSCTDYEKELRDASSAPVACDTDELPLDPYDYGDSVVNSVDPENVLCGTFKDSRDKQIYKVVKIGPQIWMAENLNFDYQIEKSSYGSLYDCNGYNCSIINDSKMGIGRLYSWAAAMDSAGVFSTNAQGCGVGTTCSASHPVRGICPKGWHIPSMDEFMSLTSAVGNRAGAKLKSSQGWQYYHGVNLSEKDEYHFSVYPDGSESAYESAYFWSSIEGEYDSLFNAKVVSMIYSSDDVFFLESFKDEYKPVRCIADDSGVFKDTLSCSAFDAEPEVLAVKTGGSKYDSLKNTLTDLRDKKTYRTTTIGTQIWMAENLNFEYEYKLDFGYKTMGPLVYRNYSSPDKVEYGRYYTWAAAMDSLGEFSSSGKGCGEFTTCSPSYPVRGVCPEGWHLPSKDEWDVLISTVGGAYSASRRLKSTDGWDNGGNGSDSYGFSALPAGYMSESSVFDGDMIEYGDKFIFFTSSEYNDAKVYIMNLDYSGGYDINLDNCGSILEGIKCFAKNNVIMPVRCLRDAPAVGTSSRQLPKLDDSSESGVLTDSRDGQTYKFVTIGSQTWMAENLNYEAKGSFCYEDEDSDDSVEYCERYGRLYTWASAMDSAGVFSTNSKSCGNNDSDNDTLCAPIYPVQGICPEGWHLPSSAEWDTLFVAMGSEKNAAKKLKSKTGWTENGNGSDDYGFSALPGGAAFDYSSYTGEPYYKYAGSQAFFWSSTEYDRGSAFSKHLLSEWVGSVPMGWVSSNDGKKSLFSVRCVRN